VSIEITVPDQDELLLDGPVLSTPVQVNRSQWTGRRKVIGAPGREFWKGKVALADIATEDDERPWRAFLFALDGPVNWFRWRLPRNYHIGPKPVVAAGASDGYTLPISGMQPSITLLEAGQYMTVPLPSGHSRAVCLTADLVTDVAGTATAQFKPALGEVPTLGVTVETADPFIPMSLTGTDNGFSMQNGVSAQGFDVEEAK